MGHAALPHRAAADAQCLDLTESQNLDQRETLLHARDSANEISENLAESRKFVKMIQRRVAQNKVRAAAPVDSLTLALVLVVVLARAVHPAALPH